MTAPKAMQTAPDDPVKLLWTGGWDSTFRLLDLVVLQGRIVQPYYVIDSGRGSVAVERETMDRIRAATGDRFGSEAAARILPTIEDRIADIPEVPEVRAAFGALREQARVGGQYCWLAEFALRHQLTGLEIGQERLVNSGVVRPLLDPELDRSRSPIRLREPPSNPHLWIFRFFEFPLIDTTKHQMLNRARKTGLLPIMLLTHSCFNPRPDGSPCGKCVPCRTSLLEGMMFRFPWRIRLRWRVRRFREWSRRMRGRVTA